MQEEDTEKADGQGGFCLKSMLITFGVNIGLAVFMSVSLHYLWQMINSLQLISHMTLFRGIYPSNYLYFITIINMML